MMQITNDQFLSAIFGEDKPWCHVTDFPYDPTNIPQDKGLVSWVGDYYSRYSFGENTNQYFTISTFYCDDNGKARRRKALYRQTHCVVLDDVREKLDETEALRLPSPSWILETSPGSEQWGYILDTPCTEAFKIDNLNDGLIESDLAPDGKDPGQRGITRYVRLPDGINNKSSKLVEGKPFKCTMTLWKPFNRVSLEQLAQPFNIDLNRQRREQRVDGAADIPDHPLVNIPDIINIKEVRSDGRFDITCPWVDEHSHEADNGTAIFTNEDGSMGFCCHHGACEGRHSGDLLNYVEKHKPGFRAELKNWQLLRSIETVVPKQDISFLDVPATPKQDISFLEPTSTTTERKPVTEQPKQALSILCDQLSRMTPDDPNRNTLACDILKEVEDLEVIDKKDWQNTIRQTMGWNATDFKEILKSLKKKWYSDKEDEIPEFYNDLVFISSLNKFYNPRSDLFLTPDAFHNTFSHLDPECRKNATSGGMVRKVDHMDYVPGKDSFFTEDGVSYYNGFCSKTINREGVKGDISPWFDHFDRLGWGDNRDHIIKWMAYTLRHPETKINHILILGGYEGSGKDFLLEPLTQAMGRNYQYVDGEDLVDPFNEYLLATKYLHINEIELGDRKEVERVAAKLKPMASAPPKKLKVNQKGISRINVRNIVNITMTTNSRQPLKLKGKTRRIYGVWSDFRFDSVSEKNEFWGKMWEWMNDGWKHVVHYLVNEVDLSDFNPGEEPETTEFTREIQESSKSPLLVTIESFVEHKYGAFQRDLVTASELSHTLRSDAVHAFHADLMQVDQKICTSVNIGKIMNSFPRVTGSDKKSFIVLRNIKKYRDLSRSQVTTEYEKQIKQERGEAGVVTTFL